MSKSLKGFGFFLSSLLPKKIEEISLQHESTIFTLQIEKLMIIQSFAICAIVLSFTGYCFVPNLFPKNFPVKSLTIIFMVLLVSLWLLSMFNTPYSD